MTDRPADQSQGVPLGSALIGANSTESVPVSDISREDEQHQHQQHQQQLVEAVHFADQVDDSSSSFTSDADTFDMSGVNYEVYMQREKRSMSLATAADLLILKQKGASYRAGGATLAEEDEEDDIDIAAVQHALDHPGESALYHNTINSNNESNLLGNNNQPMGSDYGSVLNSSKMHAGDSGIRRASIANMLNLSSQLSHNRPHIQSLIQHQHYLLNDNINANVNTGGSGGGGLEESSLNVLPPVQNNLVHQSRSNHQLAPTSGAARSNLIGTSHSNSAFSPTMISGSASATGSGLMGSYGSNIGSPNITHPFRRFSLAPNALMGSTATGGSPLMNRLGGTGTPSSIPPGFMTGGGGGELGASTPPVPGYLSNNGNRNDVGGLVSPGLEAYNSLVGSSSGQFRGTPQPHSHLHLHHQQQINQHQQQFAGGRRHSVIDSMLMGSSASSSAAGVASSLTHSAHIPTSAIGLSNTPGPFGLSGSINARSSFSVQPSASSSAINDLQMPPPGFNAGIDESANYLGTYQQQSQAQLQNSLQQQQLLSQLMQQMRIGQQQGTPSPTTSAAGFVASSMPVSNQRFMTGPSPQPQPQLPPVGMRAGGMPPPSSSLHLQQHQQLQQQQQQQQQQQYMRGAGQVMNNAVGMANTAGGAMNNAPSRRGMTFSSMPADALVYIVEFKAGRTDLYYVMSNEVITLAQTAAQAAALVASSAVPRPFVLPNGNVIQVPSITPVVPPPPPSSSSSMQSRVAGDETSAVDNNTNNNNGSNENEITLAIGTHVIVDADRGNDLGRIASLPFSINIIRDLIRNPIVANAEVDDITVESIQSALSAEINRHPHVITLVETLRNIIHTQAQNNRNNPGGGNDEHESSSPLQQPSKGGQSAREPHIKHVARVASQQEVFALQAKLMDEEKALTAAQYRARYKKLPMEVVNAEFQWDRNKLTYYYYTIGGQRVDFRDLVRELFKLYKTRIWMFDVSSRRTNIQVNHQSIQSAHTAFEMPQQQQPQQLQQPDSLQQVDAANITTSSTAFNSMEDDYLAASMKSGTKRFGNRRQ